MPYFSRAPWHLPSEVIFWSYPGGSRLRRGVLQILCIECPLPAASTTVIAACSTPAPRTPICSRAYGFQISMSLKANPWDYAQAESFMATLKKEEVYLSIMIPSRRHGPVCRTSLIRFTTGEDAIRLSVICPRWRSNLNKTNPVPMYQRDTQNCPVFGVHSIPSKTLLDDHPQF